MIAYRPAGPADAAPVAELHARSWRNLPRLFDDAFLDGDLTTSAEARSSTISTSRANRRDIGSAMR
jgi:hypothetical protein